MEGERGGVGGNYELHDQLGFVQFEENQMLSFSTSLTAASAPNTTIGFSNINIDHHVTRTSWNNDQVC